MAIVITGTTGKHVTSDKLKKFFYQHTEIDGFVYIGYPILPTRDGAYAIDALLISPQKGLVIFNLIEGKTCDGYEDIQDDAANKVESRLKSYKELVEKRKLCVDINVITYAPAIHKSIPTDDEYPLCTTDQELLDALSEINWEKSDYYTKVVSALQAISTIRKGRKKRAVENETSRGGKLRVLEESIANLDNDQSRAVIETVEGVQRIRGLAGSGKTIILALKAVYLHAQHPEWKIAVTFNTRSLKGQFKNLITTFYIEQTNEEPDWTNLHILNAWGASGNQERNGIYQRFCEKNGLDSYVYSEARRKFGNIDPFGSICEEALAVTPSPEQFYDAILVDEAQDFSSSFLRLCYEFLKPPKRLVYAYDELQNLRSQSLPSPEEIFGKNPDGSPKVQLTLSQEEAPQDIILKKCYRNSRPALVTAHALGFGIYRTTDDGTPSLIQMFEQNSLWRDIGYSIKSGSLEDGHHVVLERTKESSPKFLEAHSPIDDLIIFKSFSSKEEQDYWVANEIQKNIQQEELRPDDIVVINPDPLTTRHNVASIRSLLFQKGIASHTAGVDTDPDVFFLENNESVAFTGIYRAKGNEAAMVYIVNSESCYDTPRGIARIRNQLFTAITRSKAWVRVLGIGESMDKLIEEYQKIKEYNFTLDFTYPTQEERHNINIVNRDVSSGERTKIEMGNEQLASLIDKLKKQEIYKQDLDKKALSELIKLIGDNNE